MKIAMLSFFPAFPANDGARSRILNLARAMKSDGHDVFFVYLPVWSLTDVDFAMHEREFGHRFIKLPDFQEMRPNSRFGELPFRIRRKLDKIIGLHSGYYNYLDEFYRDAWTPMLKELHALHGFDAVCVEYVLHSKALLAFPSSVLKILDTHDSFANRHKLFINTAKKLGYWFSLRPEEEHRGLRRADVVFAIQHEEEIKFKERLKTGPPAVVTVSHFIDLDDRITDYSATDALFLGSGNDANTLSLNRFVEGVLPLVRAQNPSFRLVLAGSICGAIADDPAIVKLGRVEKLRDAFSRAPISLNPIVLGTGINIKLLDALAAGVPTVSTETGVRGLPKQFHGGVTVVADDDPQQFANAVLALTANEETRRKAGEKAFEAALLWNRIQAAALQSALAAFTQSKPANAPSAKSGSR